MTRIFPLLVGSLLLAAALPAQSNWKRFWSLKRPQKCWVLLHPFAARKALALSQEALNKTEEVRKGDELDGDFNGGQVDAFRHTYWMALLSSRIGPRRARSLGKAYERGNHIAFRRGELEDGAQADAIASEMDLFNNELGIEIGSRNKGASTAELSNQSIESIRAGKGKIVRKNKSGQPLDEQGKVIPLSKWQGIWENGRNLVPSDFLRP